MSLKQYILIGLGILFSLFARAQPNGKVLDPVPVDAQRDTILRLAVITSPIPHFKLSEHKLDELGVANVGDAMKYIPGMQLRDYGGIGGIKTVSFRSLGAAHTGVEVDGNPISNVQSGSIDLSSFELFGLRSVEFASGQNPADNATASTFIQANTISLSSILDERSEKLGLGIYSNTTTINAFEKGLYVRTPIGKKMFFGAQGMYRFGSGEYDFVLAEQSETDKITRENTRLADYRVRAVYGYQGKNSRLVAKFYFRDSDQELPGAAVLFNPSNDQRLWNHEYRGNIDYTFQKNKWKFHGHFRSNSRRTNYLDPHFLNFEGFIFSQFDELTNAAGYLVSRKLRYGTERVFFGTDAFFSRLSGNNLSANPERVQVNSVLGGTYWLSSKWRVDANLSNQFIIDNFINGDGAVDQREFFRLSPFVSLAFIPFKDRGLRFRTFYKNTFRMPTFNDMYYNVVGNTELKPEDANLFNLGLTYGLKRKKTLLEFTADAYYNRVENKIVAIPTKDLFNWSIQNIGKTEIKGIDIGFLLTWKSNNVEITLNENHSFNESLDITDSDGPTFRHQIPYTPYYSSTHGLSVRYKKIKFSSNVLYTGFRFSLNENIFANYLPAFTDINLGVSRVFSFGKSDLLADLKVMNVLDKNYQVIRSFPMPGRHLQLRLKYTLK